MGLVVQMVEKYRSEARAATIASQPNPLQSRSSPHALRHPQETQQQKPELLQDMHHLPGSVSEIQPEALQRQGQGIAEADKEDEMHGDGPSVLSTLSRSNLSMLTGTQSRLIKMTEGTCTLEASIFLQP